MPIDTVATIEPARAVRAGFCACLVGIGLGRFAYSPLIPALIEAHWFSPAAAAYLGAANLAGYLAGALFGRRLGRALPLPVVLRAMMALVALSCAACAWRWPDPNTMVAWCSVWRFAAGVAGGVIMVLAAPSILPHVAPARRGAAGGWIFTGVGLGIAGSGTIVPLLLRAGLPATWLGLAALSAALTVIGWSGWPAAAPAVRRVAGEARRRVWLLLAAYGLAAAGMVPHVVFLADFVARGLGRGIAAGSAFWVLYGAGALVGPLLAGRLADRTGFAAALRFGLLFQAAAVLLPALTGGTPALAVSAVGTGAMTPGVSVLMLGRLVAFDPVRAQAVWATATIAFALFQAAAAYADSALFAATGNYALVFVGGAAALALAAVLDLAAGRPARH